MLTVIEKKLPGIIFRRIFKQALKLIQMSKLETNDDDDMTDNVTLYTQPKMARYRVKLQQKYC